MKSKPGGKKGVLSDPISQIWFRSNKKPKSAQLPLLQHVPSLTQQAPEKMMLWGKQYVWKPSPTIVGVIAHKFYD